MKRSNLKRRVGLKPGGYLKRKTRLKATSAKTRARIRANRGWRAAFCAEVGHCQICKQEPTEWNQLSVLTVHEICRGAHRLNAYGKRACCLVVCAGCNRDVLTDAASWPIEKQCAAKLLFDPEYFSLEEINNARGRPQTAITLADLVPHLTMKG